MKEKLIYLIIIFINFNLILRLLQKGIHINDFNYEITSLLFIIGILIYFFINGLTKKTMYKFLFALLIISMGTAYYLKHIEILEKLLSINFFDNILILNDLIYEGATTYFYQYRILLILGIPIITALILWITFKFMKNFILIVSLAVVIGLWFSRSYVVVKEYLFIYIFISSLTYIIISYIKSIQKYKDAGVNVSHDKKYSYIIIYGVLIAIVISKIATMLPQEYKGKEFNNFDNYFKNEFASKTSETYGSNKDRFSLSTSGYSGNDKRLGGPILLNYQEVFKVKSDKPYYLKGNVVDFYDGNKWTKTNENFYEITSGVNMKYVYRDGFTIGMTEMINSLTIYPDKKFKTNTVFVPNYAVNVSGVEGILLYDKSPIVLSKKVIQEEYNVGFYKDNGLMDTIEHVGDTIKRISERNDLSGNQNGSLMGYFLKPIQKDINTVIIKKSSLEDRFSYRNSDDFKVVQNYGKYLQVPENISKRTYNLVYDITKDCNTSIEKVLEIKKYLTENYSYDLQVSVIPEGSEFIDYFLFVEKKGYCTYFNTAMTVMCRISGVPARYVEGFKTPSKKDDSGLYNVSSSDAHAWGEVLLGEVGNSSSNIWTIADASPTASEDIQIKEKELKEKQISDADSEEDITSIRNRQNKIGGMDSGKGENKSIVISDNQFRILFVLTTIILFILMKIIKVWKRRNNLFKYKLVTPLYNYYLDRLAVILIVKPEFQGDLEFAEGIVDSQLKEKMLVLVRGSYGEFYGKHSATRLNNKEYYDFLEEYLKDYEGKIKYLLNKYLG